METINKNSSMHEHDIERMSEVLYQLHKSITDFKKEETILSDHSACVFRISKQPKITRNIQA